MTDYFHKRWSVLFYLLVFLCLFPFVFLAQYNLPLADEFASMAYRNIMSFSEYQQLLMHTWSGRYSSNLMEIIYPLKINYLFYQCIPIIVLFLIGCILYLVTSKIINKYRLIFTLSILLIIINYVPSIADLLYYVPAIIIYTFSFLLIFGLLYCLLSKISSIHKLILFFIFSIIILGTVELYIPLILFSSVMLIISCFRQKKHITLSILTGIVLLTITWYLFSIHGNINRLNAQKNNLNILSGLSNYTFAISYWTLKQIISIPFIVILVLLFRRYSEYNSVSIKTRYVLLAIVGYMILFTPLFFINLSIYKRIGNVFYMYLLCLGILISLKLPTKYIFNIKKGRLFLILSAIIFFLISGNIRNAYTDIYYGYTKEHSSGLKNRYSLLEKNRNSDIIILKGLPIKEYTLSVQNVNDTNDTSLISDMYKYYFSIDSVVIR